MMGFLTLVAQYEPMMMPICLPDAQLSQLLKGNRSLEVGDMSATVIQGIRIH